MSSIFLMDVDSKEMVLAFDMIHVEVPTYIKSLFNGNSHVYSH